MPARQRPERPASSLADTVADSIRQQLINGELSAGERLSEVALSQQFEISRNTLREVFRILMKEGLLRHEANRGVFVAIPSIADIIDIYRVRRIIECQALEKSWPMHPAQQQMSKAVEAAAAARNMRDWRAVGTANMNFHIAIVALADSERLSALFADIAAELRLTFSMLDNAEYLHSPFVDYNTRLLQLFLDGQAVTAAQELENYLIQSERMVLAAYARRQNQS